MVNKFNVNHRSIGIHTKLMYCDSDWLCPYGSALNGFTLEAKLANIPSDVIWMWIAGRLEKPAW